MDINLLPDELKSKNKNNKILFIYNIIVCIVIIIFILAGVILENKEKEIIDKIEKIDMNLSNEKYTYSENIIKDIKVYENNNDISKEYYKNLDTIDSDEVITILSRLSKHGKLLKIEYNLGYSILLKGVTEKESNIKNIIDEFLVFDTEEINIVSRKVLENGLIEFEIEILV